MRRGFLALGSAPLLLAQAQPTFYAAYQDGLEAERQQRWTAAAAAFRRAIELRPAPGEQVLTYGNNLLTHYHPHTRLARCLLEARDLDGARAALAQAGRHGEPKAEREALARELERLTPAPQPTPQPAPPAREAAPPSPGPEHLPKPAAMPPASVPEPVPGPTSQPASGAPSSDPQAARRMPPAAPATAPRPAPPVLLPAAPPSSQGPAPVPPEREVAREGWVALGSASLLSAVLAVLVFRRRRRPAWEPAFRDPEALGPYRIERLLGRGGFASTYLAHHTGTRRRVALKMLHPYRHDDPEFVNRFRQEARLGAMLDHPNLVKMVDPGPESGPPWLAMEYIAGERLDQKLRAAGPLPLPEVRRIALQIAHGLAHAHSRGIVHRDLKPGNVIFDGDQAKIMDFGISRIVDASTLTTTYAFLGTPKYAAPEAQLKAQVGPEADRYAFGIMLFEMLAGRPPFEGETPFEILEQHQRTPLPDLRALRPDLPPELVGLVEALCRKRPEERPSDEALLQVLEGLPSASREG